MEKINVLSLFDGISCGRVALERAGIQVGSYYASEIDRHAIKVSGNNYPDIIQIGDVTKWKEWDIDWSSIDVVIGGSPCQSFSNIGNGEGLEGKSGLFFEFADIVHQVLLSNPKANFLLENVLMKKEWENIITKIMGVEPIMIDSALVSAQRRKRLYWTNIEGIEQPKDRSILFKDSLYDLPFRPLIKSMNSIWGKTKRIDGANSVNNLKSNTLTTRSSHPTQYIINENRDMCRLYSPNEYEELQTLPKDYTKGIINTERFKAIGNGWTVDVIAHIFRNINKQ